MTPLETKTLLQQVADFERKTTPPEPTEVENWQRILTNQNIGFSEAMCAVDAYYAEQSSSFARIRPANVIAIARSKRPGGNSTDIDWQTEMAIVKRDRERAAAQGITVRQMALRKDHPGLPPRNNRQIHDQDSRSLSRWDEAMAA